MINKMDKIKYLVVEDDIIDRESILRIFKKNNALFSLKFTKSGIDALSLLRGENGNVKPIIQPDYIILDINMPKMNGFEFIECLRNDNSLADIKVIIVSTSDCQLDIERAKKLDVEDYIIKPVTIEKLTHIFKQ